MRERKTEAQLFKEIRAQMNVQRGITDFAERFGFSVGFASRLHRGDAAITDRVAKALGYRRIVEYEKAK